MASVLLLVMSLSLFPYTTLFRSSELSEPDGLTRCAVGSCEGADMGAATALEAPSARTMPEAATAAARRPADPTTACPKAVSGVFGRHAARCRPPLVRTVKMCLSGRLRGELSGSGGRKHPVYLANQVGTSPRGTGAASSGSWVPRPCLDVRWDLLVVTGLGVHLQVLIDGGFDEQH